VGGRVRKTEAFRGSCFAPTPKTLWLAVSWIWARVDFTKRFVALEPMPHALSTSHGLRKEGVHGGLADMIDMAHAVPFGHSRAGFLAIRRFAAGKQMGLPAGGTIRESCAGAACFTT